MNRKETGERGEKLARDFLKKRGYKILETNYHCRRGEVDIIAREKDTLVFVEVRSKTNLACGTPEESITRTKQQRLRLTSYHYLESHNLMDSPWRIDVVLIEMDKQGRATRTELLQNAVEDA
jgi:putative endonuclease